MQKELEKDIQNAICEYLAHKKHFFWRQNVIPVSVDGNFRRLPKYVKAGVPDIIVVYGGDFIGLECKRKGAKQSESQIEFERGVKAAGGEYYVVRSIDDIKQIGL